MQITQVFQLGKHFLGTNFFYHIRNFGSFFKIKNHYRLIKIFPGLETYSIHLLKEILTLVKKK